MNSLELLQAYFKGEKHEFKGDVQEEIALQNKQSLAPFLYYVYGEPFFNVYLGCALIQEKFFGLQREITKLFNENKIKHYFIKGSVLADLYPDPVLRTRGDIDVVVQECDYERANKILKNANFIYFHEWDHHKEYNKNDLMIELHRELLPRDVEVYKYFSDGFDHVELINNYEYKLTNEFHFLFLVVHLNKHLRTGEGLKSLLDFYYMHKSYKLDYSYIEKELKDLNLYKLYNTICNCLYIITSEKLPGCTDMDVTPILEYMLINGTHGKEDYNHTFEKKMSLNNTSKFKCLIDSLFIDKVKRQMLYPKLSKCFLGYPLIIIHRFFYLLFNKGNKLKLLINSNNKEYKYDNDFYKKYGINN